MFEALHNICAGIIDEEKKVKHSNLSQGIDDAITEPSKCQVSSICSASSLLVFRGCIHDERSSHRAPSLLIGE